MSKYSSVLPISGGKRHSRSSYSPEFKRELVAASFKSDASVAAIAMKHGINPNLLHNWRAQSLRGRGRWLSSTGMVAVVVSDADKQARQPESALVDKKGIEGELEIDVEHKRIRVTGPLSREVLRLAVECLR